MQKIFWLVVIIAFVSGGYYYLRLAEENRITSLELQQQNAKIADLQTRVRVRLDGEAAGLATEKKKLTALEHQLVAAQTALAQAKAQLGDAKEQLAVDGRMPTAKDDLNDAKSSVKGLQDQLDAVNRKTHDVQAKEKDERDREAQGKARLEASYDWQIQVQTQEVIRLRQQTSASGPRRSEERSRLRSILADQEQTLLGLKEQKQAALANYYAQNNRTRAALTAQKESLAAERQQLQQQLDAVQGHYQDLKGDTEARDAALATEKDAANTQQDTVAQQESIVAKLENDVKLQKQVIGSGTAH